MSKHSLTHRNWMPLIAATALLAVTGAIIGFTAAAGTPPPPPIAAVAPATAATPTATPSDAAATPSDSRRAAYLNALNERGISTVDEATIMLVASGTCAQREVNEDELARQVMTLFPERWTERDAMILVDCARMMLCEPGAPEPATP